jgi:hypothetical protein
VSDLQTSVGTLLTNLRLDTEADRRASRELERLLVRSLITDHIAEIVPRELSVDRATAWEASAALRQRVERLGAEVVPQEQAEYRVFRREAPVTAPVLDLATPPWGRGGAVAQTVGPFTGVDGRQFWFDFYPLVRLVPVYFVGDQLPAFLVHITRLRLKPGAPLPMDKILELFRRRKITLSTGSVWLRADLLASGAPSGGYVGFRIDGGDLVFTPPPIDANGKLTIPAGGHCTIALNLAKAPAPPVGPGPAGSDAADSKLTLPDEVTFRLEAGKAQITSLNDAHWTLYGEALDFTWDKAGAPGWQPLLQSVAIPLTPSAPILSVAKSASPFTRLAAQTNIAKAGWALPVALIDTTNPIEAAGNGGLAILGTDGLTLDWRGLLDGPIALRVPLISLWPGLIYVIDAQASNRYARQRFRLWKDTSSTFRSEIDVAYTDSFLLVYAAAAAGAELLLALADAEARLDRPVDVSGTPFPIRTKNSLLVLTYSDSAQWAFLYDDNILVDSLAPNAVWPVKPGETVSLAIRNALFTISPVNSLLFFAELRDQEMVKAGIVFVGAGLFGILPTLPDPYAANVGWLLRLGRRGLDNRQAQLLLVASVQWTKAANDDDPDAVATSFTFAPLGGQQQAIAAWRQAAQAAAGQASAQAPVKATFLAAPVAAPAEQSDEEIWNEIFGIFELEQFALLDVSTNADQMGVSFAWLQDRAADDRFTFYRLFVPKQSEPATPTFPLVVRDLDLSAESRYVRAFTVPQISWEPLFNLSKPGTPAPPIEPDPPLGWNLYPNDGGPTRLFNDSVDLVPIAPIPVTEFLISDFNNRKDGFTGALFTLPFGMKAFAEFSRDNPFQANLGPAKVAHNRPAFATSDVEGGLQIRVDAPAAPNFSATFRGATMQLNNVVLLNGSETGAGTLGGDVAYIFNHNFLLAPLTDFKGPSVPLTRIDFCGYGASLFSPWQYPPAAIAETSQAFFDVFVGRTAHEVVQVRSLIYPWGIHVVRTITIFRASSGYVYRFDSGWQAESDGVYNFRTKNDTSDPYEFHPGIVGGVHAVRNIREDTGLPPFFGADANGDYLLRPVYFDADVGIEGVVSGAVNGRVPSKGMLGYVQLAPSGKVLLPATFVALLDSQFGAIGGPVDCVINVGGSGQVMRASQVDVGHAATTTVFVSAARGAVVLPKDGSWSVVEHDQDSGEVAPVEAGAAVPLIRRGKLDAAKQTTDAKPTDLLRLANPADILAQPRPGIRHYGLLQSTGTQKALFRLPSFQVNVAQLVSADPDFADAYRMVNSSGIFPNVKDAQSLALGSFQTKIIAEGYRLLDPADPAKAFERDISGPLYLINEQFLKIYVEYPGKLHFGLDSAAAALEDRWLSKLQSVAMVVDLGPLPRLVTITGAFNAQKGSDPNFAQPKMTFSKDLQPVIDVLEILAELQGPGYADALSKGLEIAMSNSAASWTYAFHARKEFPLLKFPPGDAYNQPEVPLKLECHMAVGVYFNEVLQITTDPKQLIPSAGAFLDFGATLSVMCVSLELATVYAVGTVDLKIGADIKTGPSLHMTFGFGAEIVVGLPVVGNVSLLYMVGVEINLETSELSVAAFLLFRGRAELLGGIVTVTITIEAKGTYDRKQLPSPHTDMVAQVTFGLDVSIFLVINIHFSQSWQESRQIA